jgi:hypothetical protein
VKVFQSVKSLSVRNSARLWCCLVIACGRFLSIANADPSLQVDPGRIYFKNLGHSERPRQTLTLFNGGDSVLKISAIKPSCDCIKVFPEVIAEIAPGSSADIEVTMNSGRQMGEVKKKLRISSNDPAQPELSIPVQMSVFPQFTSRPTMRTFNFNAARGKEPSRASIDVIFRAGFPQRDFQLVVDSIQGKFGSPGKKFLAASIAPIDDGKRITVVLDPLHPAGRINAELNARLDGKKLVIPIGGEMQEWIFLEPPRVDLNQLDAKDPRSMERSLTLTSIDDTAFDIKEIRFEESKSTKGRIAFKFQADPSPDRRKHVLKVRPAAGKLEKNKRHFSGKIHVTTTHPRKPKITINYFGLFQR